MDDEFFRIMFQAQSNSPAIKEAWVGAYGQDLPLEAEPASFVTRTDLQKITDALALRKGDHLVDMGCGPGGPGSLVARSAKARLTGIDAVGAAVEIARERHLDELPPDSTFLPGDFAATGLPDACADGMMSTDALLFATEFGAVFEEAARILKKGARIAFTSFELRKRSPSLNCGPVMDYRPFLEEAGFKIECYEETPDWEQRMRAVFASILNNRDQIEVELGEPAASLTLAWASLRPDELGDSRRILAVAQRP